MSNNTILNGTYDIQSLFAVDPVTNGPEFIATANALFGGWLTMAFLVAFVVILYVGTRRLDGVSDTAAGMYSTLITSFVGIILVFVKVDGLRLLTFAQWTPFFIALLVFVAIHKMNKNY